MIFSYKSLICVLCIILILHYKLFVIDLWLCVNRWAYIVRCRWS